MNDLNEQMEEIVRAMSDSEPENKFGCCRWCGEPINPEIVVGEAVDHKEGCVYWLSLAVINELDKRSRSRAKEMPRYVSREQVSAAQITGARFDLDNKYYIMEFDDWPDINTEERYFNQDVKPMISDYLITLSGGTSLIVSKEHFEEFYTKVDPQ